MVFETVLDLQFCSFFDRIGRNSLFLLLNVEIVVFGFFGLWLEAWFIILSV